MTRASKIRNVEDCFALNRPREITSNLKDYAETVAGRAAFRKLWGLSVPQRVYIDIEVNETFSHVGCGIYPTSERHYGHPVYKIRLGNLHQTRLDVLHRLAHMSLLRIGIPNSDTDHDLQFIQRYLDLVGRFYDLKASPKVKAEVKKLMVANRIKTFEKSEASREKSFENWHARNTVPSLREDLLAQLKQLKEDV